MSETITIGQSAAVYLRKMQVGEKVSLYCKDAGVEKSKQGYDNVILYGLDPTNGNPINVFTEGKSKYVTQDLLRSMGKLPSKTGNEANEKVAAHMLGHLVTITKTGEMKVKDKIVGDYKIDINTACKLGDFIAPENTVANIPF